MKTIGLDLSMNSTGVCVYEDRAIRYYIIASDQSMTKKKLKFIEEHMMTPDQIFSPGLLYYYIYPKAVGGVGNTYEERERAKTENICHIVHHLEEIVLFEQPDLVVLEGISYGSLGSAALADLAGLNHTTRYMLNNHHIRWITATPTSVKKAACGNGSAKKDEMMYAWEHCDDRLIQYKSQLKLDDLADSYFMSRLYPDSTASDASKCL